MPFFKLDALPSEILTPKYSKGAGPTVTGEQIEVGRMTFPVGIGAVPHAHPNEQICICLSGRARVRIGDEERAIGPGDAWLVPANVLHGVDILETLTIISAKNIVDGKGHRI